MSETIVPRWPAYPAGPDTWRVWCDWCERWHTHGALAGHRVAHCACRLSPYRDRGYVLFLADEPSPKRRQKPGYGCGGFQGHGCDCTPMKRQAKADA